MRNETIDLFLDRIIELPYSASDDGGFPQQEFEIIREEGLLNIVLPGELLPFDQNNTPELLNLLKLIGRASLSTGRIYEGHINALYLIHLFGTEYQKDFYFNEVIANQKLSGVWNSQNNYGIKIHDKGDGNYLLEGSKIFCSGAGWIDFPIITGDLLSENKKGWQMCIIPIEKASLIKADSSFWNPMGMKGSVSYKMDFTGIELSEDDLLGPPDIYYTQPYFSGGAIRFTAVQLGGAEAIFIAAKQFLKNAKRTGDNFQKARIAEIACLIETGNLWIASAGRKTDEFTGNAEFADRLVTYANMTRSIIEEICLKCMKLAERSVGSAGFLKPNQIERLHRDLTTYLRQPAPDEALTDIGKYVFDQTDTISLWDEN